MMKSLNYLLVTIVVLSSCSNKHSNEASKEEVVLNSNGDEECNPQALVQATKTKIAWREWLRNNGRIDHELYATSQCRDLESFRKFDTKNECVINCSNSFGELHAGLCPDLDGHKTDIIKSAFYICDHKDN